MFQSSEPVQTHTVHEETQIILFLAGGLLLGALFREINKKTGVPYTPMLFVLGIICGFFNEGLGFFGQALDTISNVDPHGLLLIFLPILIFESGFNADWHIFKRQIVQILILTVPCVLITAILIAFSIKVILGYGDEHYTWLTAFMFGSILSCTDAVAVIALLKEVGASKRFSSLIEAESLINDGTCMVLLTIAGEVAKGRSMSSVEAVGVFFELTLGGTLLGILFGFISAIWIRKIFNDEVLVVNITFIACYFVYYVAENVDLGIKISGIISLVSLGLFMAAFGKTRISTESEHAVHTFWKYAVYCAETIIFLVAGIIIGVKMLAGDILPGSLPITGLDFVKLLGLYICMTISRFIAISVFMPLLKRHGYGMTWKEALVLTHGGLRGAIGISFALVVARDDMYSPTLRQFVLFDMAGCAFLTLVINATTAGYFVKKAGLAGSSPIKQRVFIAYLQQLVQEIKSCQEELKVQPHLSAVEWPRVDGLVGVGKLQKLIEDEMDRLTEIDRHYKKPNYETQKSTLELELLSRDVQGRLSIGSADGATREDKLLTEARNKFLMALKAEYYHLFSMSQCRAAAFLLLKQSVDWDLDKESFPMNSWSHVLGHFMNPTYIRLLFFLKELPIVGRFAKNSLFNHLSYVYDVVLNYINAHNAVEGVAHSFPFTEDVIQDIVKESETNRVMAEDYLESYLTVSFPEINKSIQMKIASFNVLNRAKEYLEGTYEQGQLEDKEYRSVKKIVDTSMYSLGEMNEPWDILPLGEFIKKLMFFSFFTDEELKQILSDAVEVPFSKDEFIIKENERADYLYVITRGIATESCKKSTSHFVEKKSVGAIISYHQLISNVQWNHTSVIADSAMYAARLNLHKIKQIVKSHKDAEEYLWKESFHFLVKTCPSELDLFQTLDLAVLSHILILFTFNRYREGNVIDLKQGGIFLRGLASSIPDGNQDSKSEKTYATLTYVPPGIKNMLKAEKSCYVFHFSDFERIVQIVNSGDVEKKRGSRSLSFSSLRKVSHKQM